MVDMADVPQVRILMDEHQNITAALDRFDQDWRIVGLQLAPPASEDSTGPQTTGLPVATGDMEYPPQMVDAIKAALLDRLQRIENELADLGVSGFLTRRSKKGK